MEICKYCLGSGDQEKFDEDHFCLGYETCWSCNGTGRYVPRKTSTNNRLTISQIMLAVEKILKAK